MLHEILLIKLKLYSRFEYDYKFKKVLKINYLYILFPFYLYLLYNLSICNNFFYALSIYFLTIIGLDFHTASNNSNLNTIFIFNYLLNSTKSIKLIFLSEFIIRFSLLIPFFFLIKERFLFLVITLCFVLFSISLKEIVCNNVVSAKIYQILIFILLCFFVLFGGIFLDFTDKQLQYIEYSKIHFYKIYATTMFTILFSAIISSCIYINNYNKGS